MIKWIILHRSNIETRKLHIFGKTLEKSNNIKRAHSIANFPLMSGHFYLSLNKLTLSPNYYENKRNKFYLALLPSQSKRTLERNVRKSFE